MSFLKINAPLVKYSYIRNAYLLYLCFEIDENLFSNKPSA